MPKKYKLHPACEATARMDQAMFESLKADIESHGLLHPILRHKGQVLDGRHRLQICQELGVSPEFLDDDELIEHSGDPWAAVYSGTLHKSWNDDQRKMFAAAWQQANKKSTANKRAADDAFGNPAKSENSRDEAAEKFGVSPRGVGQAAVVIEHGCPQLQQAVRDGRVNVTLAERVARTIDDPNEQAEVVAIAMVLEKPEAALRQEVAARRVECDVPDSAIVGHKYTCPKCGQDWPEGKKIHV
jgi:hypothetical protein